MGKNGRQVVANGENSRNWPHLHLIAGVITRGDCCYISHFLLLYTYQVKNTVLDTMVF